MAATLPDGWGDEIRAIVRDVVRTELGGIRAGPRREVVSKRTAARMLGIDRGKALSALIAEGHLRAIQIGTRTGIPLADVERVIANGVPANQPAPRRHLGAAAGAAQLRALKIEG